MRIAKKFSKEFKGIYTGEDVLKENEEHANIVIATAMINMFIPLIIIFIISVIGISAAEINSKGDIIFFGLIGFIVSFIIGIFGLIIPAIICIKKKGQGKHLKYLLLIALLITMTLVDILLTYKATLILVIPIIFAARYYSKKLTRNVAIITIGLFAISTYVGANEGFIDLNYVNIPKNTTITVKKTLQEEVKHLNLNKKNNSYNLLINSYLPELLIYIFIIGYGCIQISQSGKNMINRQKELSEEGARIESELNIAREIQKNMLPSTFPAFPNHKEFDIYADMIPAKEVGGDFYDMFLIDDNKLAITIADVSGKGVPAALIMMTSRTLIKNTALNKCNIEEIFYKVNNLMCEGNTTNSFVTSWFGILNLKNGSMEYVNAGHNAPLLYTKENNCFEYIKEKPNFVIAGIENTKYTSHKLQLKEGDKLFLYTDGVVEATNENNELYSEVRLQSYLNKNITDDLINTIKGVKEDIDKFVGKREQFDDITMLELLFKEKNKMLEKKFMADIKELNKVISYVDNYFEKIQISKKKISEIELVIEELFVNVCNYAYKDQNGYFKISISYDDNIIKIKLEDEGIEFNPLEWENPNITLSLEERKIGGLGIMLVKKNMDDIRYIRENSKNILIMRKFIKENK